MYVKGPNPWAMPPRRNHGLGIHRVNADVQHEDLADTRVFERLAEENTHLKITIRELFQSNGLLRQMLENEQ